VLECAHFDSKCSKNCLASGPLFELNEGCLSMVN